jgi:septum formation protein
VTRRGLMPKGRKRDYRMMKQRKRISNVEPISTGFPLILASSSPRRKRLLRQVSIPFRALPSRIVEEGTVEEPEALVRSLAERKAMAASRKRADQWVLGADTVVVLGEEVLGKPESRTHAASMLARLSGKEHRVITGFSILAPGGVPAHSEEVVTFVRVKKLERREIEAYIETGEPFGKAGSYAIQGTGTFLVESITGSYTNVVGLPVSDVIAALLKTGALKGFPLKPEVKKTEIGGLGWRVGGG